MGHLLKINCAHSPLNLRILSLTCVPFTLTTVQMPNIALTHKKQITVLEERSWRVETQFWKKRQRQSSVGIYIYYNLSQARLKVSQVLKQKKHTCSVKLFRLSSEPKLRGGFGGP
jgi:hypothetical protein